MQKILGFSQGQITFFGTMAVLSWEVVSYLKRVYVKKKGHLIATVLKFSLKL